MEVELNETFNIMNQDENLFEFSPINIYIYDVYIPIVQHENDN